LYGPYIRHEANCDSSSEKGEKGAPGHSKSELFISVLKGVQTGGGGQGSVGKLVKGVRPELREDQEPKAEGTAHSG